MSYWNFARSPVSVRLLLDFGQARHIEAASLLRGTQLGLPQLADPDMTVSASQELAVAANLLRHMRDEPEAGLQVGLSYHLSAYGILGYGLMSSATGADALALVRRFLPLTYAFASVAHRRIAAADELAFEPPGDLAPALQRFVVERAMGATSRLLRDVLGSGFTLAGFGLRYAAPPPGRLRRAPTRVLGAEVRYGAGANTLSFAHEHLARPLPQANAVTAAMCERMCAELLARRRTRLDTAAFVREHLAALPPGHAPVLADLARLLNTSERTLKRRLHQEGTSFRDLSNAVRYAKAVQLMGEDRMTMTEIAAELGFGDLSSFSQAFKRWSGFAPTAAKTTGP
ncbi:MAG: AraC family transcriptional regulator [Burkholderiaceae bacterium]|nr:MAG: AraC family transcriptional regulator [Burkholderiaceae bacterium]